MQEQEIERKEPEQPPTPSGGTGTPPEPTGDEPKERRQDEDDGTEQPAQ